MGEKPEDETSISTSTAAMHSNVQIQNVPFSKSIPVSSLKIVACIAYNPTPDLESDDIYNKTEIPAIVFASFVECRQRLGALIQVLVSVIM